MAEETSGGEGGAPEGAKPSILKDTQTLIILGSSLVTLIALGATVYTKMLWKKPSIVEEKELQKKEEELKTPPEVGQKFIVSFDQMMINIAMTSGKAHYATIAFSVECRDSSVAAQVKAKSAIFTDKMIAALSKKQLTELNTIQGKLLLKSALLREYNELIGPTTILDVYFSTFILQ